MGRRKGARGDGLERTLTPTTLYSCEKVRPTDPRGGNLQSLSSSPCERSADSPVRFRSGKPRVAATWSSVWFEDMTRRSARAGLDDGTGSCASGDAEIKGRWMKAKRASDAVNIVKVVHGDQIHVLQTSSRGAGLRMVEYALW